jgi:hypothetical protein
MLESRRQSSRTKDRDWRYFVSRIIKSLGVCSKVTRKKSANEKSAHAGKGKELEALYYLHRDYGEPWQCPK